MANDLVGLRKVISDTSRFLEVYPVDFEDVEDMADVKRWLLSLGAAIEAEEKKRAEEPKP